MGRRSCWAGFAALPLLLASGCGGHDDTFGSGGAGGSGGATTTSEASTGSHTGGGGAGIGGGGTGGGQGGAGQGGGGGAAACSPGGSACVVSGDGNAGLCDGATSTCVDCADPADDGRCVAAYGASHLCISGSCVAGDCRQDSDCTAMSNQDVCTAHTCNACDPDSDAVFRVDPNAGDDTTATGSGTSGGQANAACAYKTMTAAIAAINALDVTNASILITGPSTVGPGETWPLVVPGGCAIAATGGLVTVSVPAAQTGFQFGSPSAGIDGGAAGITIDGGAVSGNGQQHGVSTLAGSDGTNYLANVTLQGFSSEAILVNAGGLTIQGGVRVTTSGQPAAQLGPNVASHFAILAGDGAAQLFIDTTNVPTVIEGNNDGGVGVQGLAKLNIFGMPGPTIGTGTVVIQNNPGPGIEVANLAQMQQQASITGVVAYENGSPSGPAANTSSGLRVVAGASVRVRGSVLLGNGYSGIHVSGNGAVSGSFANIDLGAPGFPGANIVQHSAAQGDANVNGAGICFEVAPGGPAASLLAEGNVFSDGVDCAATAATLTTNAAKTCGNAKDVGASIVTATVDVTMCSY